MGWNAFWDTFWRDFSWGDFIAQVVATLVGAGVAALIAFRLFKREQEARLAEAATQEAIRLQRMRGEAAAQLLFALRGHLEAERKPSTPRAMSVALEDALMQLLFDGTQDSLDLNHWIQARLQKFEMLAASPLRAAWYEYQAVRATLIGWVRGDVGVLASVRRELNEAASEEQKGAG